MAALFVALACFFPFFEQIHSANELSRLYLTLSIVEEGTVSIDAQLTRLGNIHDKALRDGRHYSDKAPGTSFVAVPAIWAYYQLSDAPTLRGSVRLARLCSSTIPTAFLLLALLAFLRGYVPDPSLRRVLVLAYALASPATTYGTLLFGHQLSGVLVFATFLLARECGAQSYGRAALTGLVAGAAVCVEYQNALFLVPIAVLFLWRVRSPVPVLAGLLGLLPVAIGLGLYHQAAFGGPFTTGYHFVASSFAEVHAQGFMGIATPKWAHVTLSFVSSSKGLFFFAPWLVLGYVGLVRLRGADGLVTAGMVVLWSLFVVSMVYPVGGWTVSQRHLTPMVPWLLLPAGLLVTRFRDTRPLLAGLVLVGLLVTGVSSVVWPHFPEHLANPFWQIGWPLFSDGWVPESLLSDLSISAKSVAMAIGVTAALGILADLIRSGSGIRRFAWPLVAAALVFGFVRGTSGLFSDQDTRRDRRFIERVYEIDPASPPPTRLKRDAPR